MTTELPDWVTVGASVRIVSRGSWRGDVITDRTGTISKITKTQVVLANGERYRTKNLSEVGRDWYRSDYLISADDPLIAQAAAKAARKDAGYKMEGLGRKWANDQSDENAAALRAAVKALAPHICLTVTDPATLCTFERDGLRCMLDSGHAATGEWHKGLGWVASLGHSRPVDDEPHPCDECETTGKNCCAHDEVS